jgi:hypothetical protein
LAKKKKKKKPFENDKVIKECFNCVRRFIV